MKRILQKYVTLLILIITAGGLHAQEDSAREVVGISGNSEFSKYKIQIIGNKKDTISVFDSAALKLPLKSDYYSLRVYRYNNKGELKEYKVKSFNMTVTFSNDSSWTQEFTNKYMDDPLLSWFKQGRSGNMLAVSNVAILDENSKERRLGSFMLLYR